MTLTIRRTANKDRVLHYGTVAATLLKDIGNASNQPYLQAIASVSLLIMETVQRVRDNKDACMQMTERAYELVCAIINICRDSEADLAPAMVRSITQFSETLEKILVFVRNQVKGGLFRRMFRSMEDSDLIKECNTGLKHALDVFGVQSGIIAAMTMAEMQKDAKLRHEELIAILNEKRSRPKRSSTEGSGSSSSRRKRSSKNDLSRSPSTVSMLPASPKIFYGRDEEIQHLTKLMTLSAPARIVVCGAEGLGKTSVAVAASHSPEISQMFGQHRYFVECEGATDVKQLVAAIAQHLNLEGTSRKHVIRHLGGLAKEGEAAPPVLLVLDALDRAWKPHENRNDVEDFLSLLADLQHLTLMVTIRGGERPRQVKWTRPFLPTLQPLSPAATRSTFLDISDVDTADPDLEALLALTEGNPGTAAHMALLASFEGCSSLVARWEQEGSALLLDKAHRTPAPHAIFADGLCDEPEEMRERAPTAVAECDLLGLLEPDLRIVRGSPQAYAPAPSIDSVLKEEVTQTTLDAVLRRPSLDSLMMRQGSLDSCVRSLSSIGSRQSSLDSRARSLDSRVRSHDSRTRSLDGLIPTTASVGVTT
ncbi:hypothetical protein DFH08DRAFT_450261 [Mycena albidolilacea]|uniref:Novel STAND NTPase 1 domain-containing protein n=1 Tax=Mycena albidolilacea TaxID=1033008 RepID=A0AAD7ED42_9AGAR|nr:hypothetical protein DFH08DRAFT_450261 [Mycena albidolilacea]